MPRQLSVEARRVRRAKAIELRFDDPNLSCEAIAERLGVSCSTVNNWICQAGLRGKAKPSYADQSGSQGIRPMKTKYY